MADEPNNGVIGSGCFWILAFALFFPAAIVSELVWPDQTANQFVGHTLAIGFACTAALLVIGVALAFRGRR